MGKIVLGGLILALESAAGDTHNDLPSTDKDTESITSTQENGSKRTTQSAVEAASAEVETFPTEAQKETGNYKCAK